MTYLTLRVLLVLQSPYFPPEQGRNTDDSTQDPHHRDHDHRPPWRPLFQVVDGLRDAPVPVQTDEAQVDDARRTQENVHGAVDVAPEAAKDPVAHQFIGEGERHYNESDGEVSNGQTRDEPILNVFERLLGHDRDDDQHVADNDNDHEDNDEDTCNDNVCECITAGIKGVENNVCIVEEAVVERHVVQIVQQNGIVGVEGTVCRIVV